MVVEIITNKLEEIAALCRKYRVARLDLFGSATTDRFDPETSDLDFLVDLGDYTDDYAARFFAFRRDLKQLMQRKVDLASAGGLEDGWFFDEVEATKVNVYDARYDQLVA